METLEVEDSFEEFRKQIFDLTTMLEIGKTLNASLSLTDVMDIIILTCKGHFHASEAIILLSEDENSHQYTTRRASIDEKLVISDLKLINFIKDKEGIIEIEELKKLSGFEKIYEYLSTKKIVLLVPMRFRGRINGILCLHEKEAEFGPRYTEEEKRYLDIIAGFASVAIENAKLYEMATTDRKTKLYNHGYFQNKLIEEIDRAERYHTDLSLLMLDLDHFKKINDTYGHMFGDEVLIKTAKTIKQQLREFDIPARFGGEEFAVILPETKVNEAKIVAERLRKSISLQDFNAEGEKVRVTVSIGIAGFIHDSEMTEDILIEQADKALYHAKQTGRNRVCIYGEK